MQDKALFTMKYSEEILIKMIKKEGDKVLGGQYKDKFEVGDYIQWRNINRNENYEETIVYRQGIITNLRPIDVGGRIVWYADVMENGGSSYLVLLSKITKIETN